MKLRFVFFECNTTFEYEIAQRKNV